MTSNPRMSVTFTARQLELIEKESARLGISTAELVRRIIDRFFEKGDRK
jgi:hypothetical protein